MRCTYIVEGIGLGESVYGSCYPQKKVLKSFCKTDLTGVYGDRYVMDGGQFASHLPISTTSSR